MLKDSKMNEHNNDTLKKKPFREMLANTQAFAELRLNILMILSVYYVYSACCLLAFLTPDNY